MSCVRSFYVFYSLVLMFCFFGRPAVGQDKAVELDTISLGENADSLYREDQVYFGIGFNAMTNLPDGVEQSGFSGGIHAGVIRDMPINKQRNWAFGAGLGFSANVYNNSLFIGESKGNTTLFKPIDDDNIDFSVNRFSTFLVEAPLQIRWRTSTADSFKFWRIYAGLRIGYVYYFKSRFKQPGNEVIQTDLGDRLNRWRYGATFTFGYNTFNFQVYYSLNSFFNGKMTGTNQDVDVATFKVGLMFYVF